jgi:hypothetical protein
MLAPCLRRTVLRPLLIARVPAAGASFSTVGVLRRDARATYNDNNMTGNYTDVYVSTRFLWRVLCCRTDARRSFYEVRDCRRPQQRQGPLPPVQGGDGQG